MLLTIKYLYDMIPYQKLRNVYLINSNYEVVMDCPIISPKIAEVWENKINSRLNMLSISSVDDFSKTQKVLTNFLKNGEIPAEEGTLRTQISLLKDEIFDTHSNGAKDERESNYLKDLARNLIARKIDEIQSLTPKQKQQIVEQIVEDRLRMMARVMYDTNTAIMTMSRGIKG